MDVRLGFSEESLEFVGLGVVQCSDFKLVDVAPSDAEYPFRLGSDLIPDILVARDSDILLAGPGIKAGTVSRLVAPKDIAPTVASMLGLKPPSASSGKLLVEALSERQ